MTTGRGGRRTLDPKLDIVFWMLFGAEQNRPLLISLLNAVLRPTTPIESAEVLPAEPERETVEEKNIALDVRVRLQGGEQVDVEMQSQRRPALRERALYYWARLYAGQLQRGAPYPDLRRCAVVLITDFHESASPRFHSRFQVRDQQSGEPLTDHLELHLVELPKLESAVDRNDEPTLAAWGKFLSATADEDLEALAMEDPVLKQAKDALELLSADPDARLRAERREMALISDRLDRAKVRREGREEGKAEGKAEARAELLLEVLSLKFAELPADTASRLANASEAELREYLKRAMSAQQLDDVFTRS